MVELRLIQPDFQTPGSILECSSDNNYSAKGPVYIHILSAHRPTTLYSR
jgi:hypothetical protein